MFFLYTRGGRMRLAIQYPNKMYAMVVNTGSVRDGKLLLEYALCPVTSTSEIETMRTCADPNEAKDAGLPQCYVDFMTHTLTQHTIK